MNMRFYTIAFLLIILSAACDRTEVVSNGQFNTLYATTAMLDDNEYSVTIWQKFQVFPYCPESRHSPDPNCPPYYEYEPIFDEPESILVTDGTAEVELGSCNTLCLIVQPGSSEFRIRLNFKDKGLDDAWMWSWLEPRE